MKRNNPQHCEEENLETQALVMLFSTSAQLLERNPYVHSQRLLAKAFQLENLR
jgi:hypothetical protein